MGKGLRVAVGLAVAGGVGIGLLAGPAALSGWGAGAAWNLINVRLLQRLAGLLGRSLRQVRRELLLLLLAKFGLLYPAGILALWTGVIPRIHFAAGFTAVLAGVAAGGLSPPPLGCDSPKVSRIRPKAGGAPPGVSPSGGAPRGGGVFQRSTSTGKAVHA